MVSTCLIPIQFTIVPVYGYSAQPYYYYTHFAHPLPKHNVYSMTIDHDTHTASLEHHKELNSEATQAEPDHYPVIKLLMDKLDILDDGCGDWENEVEEGMGCTI